MAALAPSLIERELCEFFARNPDDAAAVYLFGSQARGTARDDSDVDLGILFRSTPPATLEGRPFRLEAELASLLGRSVQIVVLNDAPVDLVHRVLRDGRLLLDRDRSRRIAFEVRARNEYFDLQPIVRRYRRTASRAR